MSNSQITIFYSWQSDLPGSETRNIIQDAIKDAVKLLRDTVDIEADRDTKGEYGSPDIAQTIFSKIDDCDIFIADVSAVCQYETTDKDGNKKVKYMPNPNVMLELGYAIHVVGWENVICVLNADYGAPEEMPFDIASRRLTPFSTKDGKSKGYFNERWLKIHCQVTLGIDMSGFRIMSVGNCEPQEESDNDRLSGELVPIISCEQFEDEAEKFLTRYYPEALEKPMRVPIETIASDMKLQVIEDIPLSDDLTYFGTIIFDNGNVLDKHRKITIRNAKRGTVYLDPRVSYKRCDEN